MHVEGSPVFRGLAALGLVALMVAMPSTAAAQALSVEHHPGIPADEPVTRGPQQLILDDGTTEADVGFTATSAFQFMWFNAFDSPASSAPFDLDEIQVLFPAGPEIVAGAAIQLAVFQDPDGDPTNGATLLTAIDETIQVADGSTFSVYTVDPPVQVPQGGGTLLVGVINRFVTSGVSPASRPAALDTTSSAGRSWFAQYTGDPPDPPSLPSDDVLALIDAVEPGNWMIRASGASVSAIEVPTLGREGLLALMALVILAAVTLLRRRRGSV